MAGSVALIAIFVALIGVTNTILVSVFERTREIGVMKALGASSFDVFKIVWSETVIVCALGGLAGVILAISGSGLTAKVIRGMLPYAPQGELVLIKGEFVWMALLAAIVVGLIAGTYPAWRASRMKPVEAIRAGE
jgi:putative ABC transport system permease protein